MSNELAENFCQYFQRDFQNYFASLPQSQDIYRYRDIFMSDRSKKTIIYLFENLPDILENTELIFIYLHQEFLVTLKNSGLVKMRGCRRVILTKLFWDERRRYQSGEMIFFKV